MIQETKSPTSEDIILNLNKEKEPMSFSKLLRTCGGNFLALTDRMLALKLAGFISEEYRRNSSEKWFVSLTNKGKTVATCI